MPKNTHVTLSHTSLPAREIPKIPKLADELEEPATSDAPAGFLASDFVMMDADSDMEAVVGLLPEQGHGHNYVPKTMQEMAEEHAARWQQMNSDADDDLDDEVNDGEQEMASPQVPLAVRPTRKSKKQPTVKITLPSEASTPNSMLRSRSTKSKINKKPSTTPNLKRKRRSSKKRVEEESDSADLTVASEEDQEDEQPSPNKRTRGRAAATKANRTPVAVAPSTRTLRPRISKRTAQIEEEKQNGDDR